MGNDIQSQTRRTLENIKAVIEASGLTMPDVVRVSVFLRNGNDFEIMDEAYKKFFPENTPTRTTVEAKLLNPDMLIEINAIACRE